MSNLFFKGAGILAICLMSPRLVSASNTPKMGAIIDPGVGVAVTVLLAAACVLLVILLVELVGIVRDKNRQRREVREEEEEAEENGKKGKENGIAGTSFTELPSVTPSEEIHKTSSLPVANAEVDVSLFSPVVQNDPHEEKRFGEAVDQHDIRVGLEEE